MTGVQTCALPISSYQFMMRLLTGDNQNYDASSSSSSSSAASSFEFVPSFVTSFGSIVIAEGCDRSRSISWIHAWTVTDGIVTQVREYFNTSLTVTRLGDNQAQPSDYPSKKKSAAEINSVHCTSLWESSLSSQVGKSVPGLVLAI